MKVTVKGKTLQTACFVFGGLQLAGIAEVVVTGWEVSALDVKLFGAMFLISLGPAVYCAGHPRLRGFAFALVSYAGLQVAAGLITTPTRPTTMHLLLGAAEGVAFLVLGVYITRWMEAARALHLEYETTRDSDTT